MNCETMPQYKQQQIKQPQPKRTTFAMELLWTICHPREQRPAGKYSHRDIQSIGIKKIQLYRPSLWEKSK